jgi:hypothetical protein
VTYASGADVGSYNPFNVGLGVKPAAQLSERTRILILNLIQASIATELQAVRTDRNDNAVVTEPPQSFFIFSGAHTYQCPAVFVVVDSGEVPDERTGTNYVSVLMKVYVSAVVEGLEENSLTIKAERYQAALFKILHQTVISDTTDNVKIYIRCKRFQFSDLYTKSRKNDNMGDFRKEVAIELEVQHWENPTS